MPAEQWNATCGQPPSERKRAEHSQTPLAPRWPHCQAVMIAFEDVRHSPQQAPDRQFYEDLWDDLNTALTSPATEDSAESTVRSSVPAGSHP
jgi:hypothetical protein